MKIKKRAVAFAGAIAVAISAFSAAPASAWGEQTSCGAWMRFSGYSGPASIGNGYRDMWTQTCIHKKIEGNTEYFAGTLTVFNGSGTSANYGYNYGRWGSRELQFRHMTGQGLGSGGGSKTMYGWYPNNACFHGEIKAGDYKSCSSGWVKDDTPGTANRISGNVLAYAWVLQPGTGRYELAQMGEVDESPWLT
ncbi:hypothetical protein GTY86_36905 [Streptomyces sp. SID5770]|uniref:hypothetical protein n=1 Tax=Streptomyces sp. SID5770 TaxID=2690308 RepID=UPI00136B0C7E|nr:hypothetical protein [Streptomyces sp. SID5770]MZE56750.1 hypothetical protein [Streptomyces sp. SID5770]